MTKRTYQIDGKEVPEGSFFDHMTHMVNAQSARIAELEAAFAMTNKALMEATARPTSAPVAAQEQAFVPRTPEQMIEFIGSNFGAMQFADEDGKEWPKADVTYTLTVHDLLSAFNWAGWHDDACSLCDGAGTLDGTAATCPNCDRTGIEPDAMLSRAVNNAAETVYLGASQPAQEPVYCGCGDQIMPDDGARCGTCVTVKYQPAQGERQPCTTPYHGMYKCRCGEQSAQGERKAAAWESVQPALVRLSDNHRWLAEAYWNNGWNAAQDDMRNPISEAQGERQPESQVGNFGDTAEDQLRRRVQFLPLPNYTDTVPIKRCGGCWELVTRCACA